MKPRSHSRFFSTLLAGSLTTAAHAGILITEVNSNANAGDFFEIHNTGNTPADVSGWKWDDDSLSPSAGATISSAIIPAGGVLIVSNGNPGTEAAFKSAWALSNDVQVIATGGPGLGGNDAVALFDASNQFVTGINYKSSTVTVGSISIPPLTRTGGLASLGGHAGPAAGASLGDSVSAVWDGVSTTSPQYTKAAPGFLQGRSQPGSLTSIGSPGTAGTTAVAYIPPTPPVIGLDTNTVPAGQLRMRQIARLPLFGSEISAYDTASKRLFVTSSVGLQVVDLSNPRTPTLLALLDFTTPTVGLTTNDVTSVSIRNGKVAVAVPNPVKQNPGHVVFLNAADASFISKVQVGVLPDQLTFTPDGTKVLTANEGEVLADGTDPAPGSVSIIDVSNGFSSPTVTTVGFTTFDSQAASLKAAGVRIFEDQGNLKLPSLDLEPEYVAVSPDSTKAMVSLQEANAVALLDIPTATFTAILPLGEKDFSTLLADFSDRDGPSASQAINLTTGNPVFGLYMPDAIAAFQANGQTYYITANEGDDRNDFLNPDETTTVNNAGYVLDPTTFPNAASLKTDAKLGRLTVSNAPGLRGDTDGDGDIDRILSYGGRSISILDANGNRIWDSADLIDTTVAALGSSFFDDGRSDNKSTEPEGVTIGTVQGRTIAFVALERAKSIIAFDVSNPNAPTFAGIVGDTLDSNPESVAFISETDSPIGQAMIAVTNETSNTLTLYTVAPYTLQLLHLSDAEAGLLASQTAPNLAALVDAFDGTFPNTLILSGGDNFIPSPFLNAGTDPALNAVLGATAFARPDIAIHNEIGVEASAIGNHEWDLGSAVFADAIRPSGAWVGAQFPHLSLNLDFSADSAVNARFVNVPLDGNTSAIPEANTRKGQIVPTAIITKGGEKIGLVGVTTQLIESISSPSGTEVKGFPTGPGANGETDDMDLLASQIQPYLNELAAEGVNKIVLLSHLQQITNEQALATKLTGVDIILSAGSNTRLGDVDDLAVAFPGHAATFSASYPLITAGTDGKPTLIVNTDNEFTYLGRLIVDFDAFGQLIVPTLTARTTQNGAYASTTANVAAAWGVSESILATTAFAPGTKGARVKAITDAVQSVINAKDGTVYGYTNVYLEGERAFVRSEETNLGDITADANASALRQTLQTTQAIVSLKNGGGIRAQIGAVSNAGGSATKLPPPANPSVGKLEGGISQLDIENALRFDNKLIAFETTPAGLKAILEHGVALWPNQGRFPQVSGVSFAWNPSAPAGNRITSLALLNDRDHIAHGLYQNGQPVAGAPNTITIVTLNFLANDGDGYPMKANGQNFRYLLADGTLGPVLNEANDFTLSPSLPANPIGEQKVFADFLSARYPSPAQAYSRSDTSATTDLRIQNTTQRTDLVLPYSSQQLLTLNTYSPGLLALGVNPEAVITQTQLANAIQQTRTLGQQEVVANPKPYGLSDVPAIRLDGMVLEFQANATATMTLQSSDNLTDWVDEAVVPNVEIDLSGGKRFFRFKAATPEN